MATVAELGAYAINPRGNLWLNDDSSFGQKMLLKMGWKKGKGLGKKEDGIKENLKVKFRNTNSGLGFKDDSYKNVMKTEYESILKSLRSEYPQQKSVTNYIKNVGLEKEVLKQKSRIVKGRIRYPKLYSAKDVSRYSENDMKSIFICSLPFEDNEEESKESGLSLNQDSKDSELYIQKEFKNDLSKPQETYTSQLSISDYFNMKIKGKKGSEQKIYTSEIKQEEIDSCHSKTNYEIEKTKCAFQKGRTKNKEIKYNSEGNEQKIYTSEIEQEEIDSCHSKTNYEIEKTKSAFQRDRTKNKEIKSNSEGNKSVCELNQKTEDIQNDMMTEDGTRVLSRKKHKKKRKSSEISLNEEDCKTISSLVEKKWEEAGNPSKKRKKMAENSGNDCEGKMQENSNLMVDELNISDKKRKKHKKESLNSADTIESSSNQNIETTSYKKKKKSHRNDSKSSNPIELLSVTSLEKEVSTNSQLANNVSTESLTETAGETFTNIDSERSEKKQKKLKNKFKSVKKLKSCLKSKSSDYTVKNVSFNESVSYKIIDSEDESTSSVSDSEDENSKDFDITASNNNPELELEPSDTKTEMEDCNIEQQNETNCINVSETGSEEKTKKCNSLSGLPSPDSPYYNSWVESQQQAIKMELYKNLLKGLQKHDILKTSNLSFIKGYGNWGF